MPGIITHDDWIARLPADVSGAITARMQSVSAPVKAEFSHAGDKPSAIYRIESGYLKLVALQEDGRQVLITIYGPGACFAETALIAQRPLNHTTIALTDARVSVLSAQDFWSLYAAHAEIADALCQKFAKIISTQISYRETRATTRLAKRLAMLFEEMAAVCGRVHQDAAIEIPLPITQSDMAEHFDVTRQTVHRELGELRARNLVKRHGNGWLVCDLRKLAEFA